MCEKFCYKQGDDNFGVLFVCAKIPAGSGPPKEALGEANGDGGGGEEKATVWKKNAFNAEWRWLGGGRVFWFVLLFFEQRGRFPVRALVLNVAWSD